MKPARKLKAKLTVINGEGGPRMARLTAKLSGIDAPDPKRIAADEALYQGPEERAYDPSGGQQRCFGCRHFQRDGLRRYGKCDAIHPLGKPHRLATVHANGYCTLWSTLQKSEASPRSLVPTERLRWRSNLRTVIARNPTTLGALAALRKAGPYVGPRGGLWADPQHKTPWHKEHGGKGSHVTDHQQVESHLITEATGGNKSLPQDLRSHAKRLTEHAKKHKLRTKGEQPVRGEVKAIHEHWEQHGAKPTKGMLATLKAFASGERRGAERSDKAFQRLLRDGYITAEFAGGGYRNIQLEPAAKRALGQTEKSEAHTLEKKLPLYSALPLTASTHGAAPQWETTPTPDFADIYFQPESDKRNKLERQHQHTRRRATAIRNKGVFSFHGGDVKVAPELRYEPDKTLQGHDTVNPRRESKRAPRHVLPAKLARAAAGDQATESLYRDQRPAPAGKQRKRKPTKRQLIAKMNALRVLGKMSGDGLAYKMYRARGYSRAEADRMAARGPKGGRK
jgi:hypothetical protein